MNRQKSGSGVSLLPYIRQIPQILIYQLISRGILFLILLLYRSLTGFILWNVGRPAYTSGDLPYLMVTWEGWALLACGFLILVIYTIFDVNAAILMSEKLLKNEKVHALSLIRSAAGAMRRFKGVRGFWVILYVSLAAPLTGAAFGITLTSNFVIPNFIVSVIRRQGILHLLYAAGLIALGIAGIVYVFTFDFVLLGGQPVRQAMNSSRIVMKRHWKHFLSRYLLYVLRWLALLAAIIITLYLLPCVLMRLLPLGDRIHHAGIIFFSLLTASCMMLYFMLVTYYTQMKLTLLYHAYTDKENCWKKPERKRHLWFRILIAAVVAVSVLFSVIASADFEDSFPVREHAQIAAHRAGGNLANENTVLALKAAIAHGASAGEIDVQRTKDGAYIINHDSTFKRCCGDPRSPGDMTLAEIRQLKVNNLPDPFQPKAQVAELSEMLDAAKGKIKLFIELKGKSADRKMVQDVIAMVKERDMVQDVYVISLDYELVDYMETAYPEINTGYLCFFAFGRIEDLNCDAVFMEEEIATDENIKKVNSVGKQSGVWTVNTSASLMNFLMSDVDWIITDEIPLAAEVRKILKNQSDEVRVLERILRWV